MKRLFNIFSTLCLTMCLLSCHKRMSEAVDRTELSALSPDGRVETLPRLAERRDNVTDILLVDTLQVDTTKKETELATSYPHDILADYECVPLDPTPGFHIEYFMRLEMDDGRFFVHARDRSGGFRDACFIFNQMGKFLLNIVPPEINLGNESVKGRICDMAINRRTKEIRMVCKYPSGGRHIGGGSSILYACYYTYKGKYLRKVPIIPNGMWEGFFTDDWMAGRYFIMHEEISGKPQLILYNEKQKKFRRALLVPDKVDVHGVLDDQLASAPNGELFYAAEHSDTVWQVTPDALIARYILHGPSVGATVSPYERDSTFVPGTYELSKEGRLCRAIGGLSPFLVSNNFMLMTYQRWSNMEWVVDDDDTGAGHPDFRSGTRDFFVCIVDRRTNHVQWLQSPPIRISNLCRKISEGIRCPRYLTPNDELVYMEDVNTLKRMADENQDTNTLTDKEKEFIRKLPVDGNPVLFLVPLKHF